MKKLIFLVIVFISLISGNNTFAQTNNIIVSIVPDDFPDDIFWQLLNERSEIIASGDLIECVPNQECHFDLEVEGFECLSLLIEDKHVDEESSIQYAVFQNESLIISQTTNEQKNYHDINCDIGESCSNAILLNLPISPFEKIKVPMDKDYWFKLTPEEYGLYRITTCVNLISGQGYPDTKLWIYDACNREIVTEGPEGALGYSDNFIQCEPASAFHYFPLNEDVDYFIRVRREQDNVDLDSIEVKFLKLPSIFGCTDPSSCNYNPYANIDNGMCEYSSDCAPDLSVDQQYLVNSLLLDSIYSNDECLVAEGCLRGPGEREIIRFATKIDNIGSSDYILGAPEEGLANFSNTNCHGHWHQDGYAEYLLFDGSGMPEPIGFKTGFCVLDLDCDGQIPKYICSYMGISVGCSDIYSSDIDCQWIDVTDVEDGVYTLVVRVNWNRFPDIRGFQELGYENNWAQVCFKLDRSSGQATIVILEDCPEYQDCLGFTYGQARVDCEGVCGGSAHFGDLDGSGELTKDDLSPYMSLLQNGNTQTSSCFDLDNSGDLNIYDAALANQCAEINNNEFFKPFHSHCTFPNGFLDIESPVQFQIINNDNVNQTFDIEILSNKHDLSALQITFEGMILEGVVKLYTEDAEYLVHSSNSIFILHGETKIARSNEYKTLLKVKYKNADQICISDKSIVINDLYNKVPIVYESNCIVTSSKDILQDSYLISIYPNPTQDNILISIGDSNLQTLQLFDINGALIYQMENLLPNQTNQLSLEEYNDGIYFLKLTTADKKIHFKKIVKNG